MQLTAANADPETSGRGTAQDTRHTVRSLGWVSAE